MDSDVSQLACRVKRGVAFLDEHVPNWRRVMRANVRRFDVSDPSHCILGTLEHRKALVTCGTLKSTGDKTPFERALRRFRLCTGITYGFDVYPRTSDRCFDVGPPESDTLGDERDVASRWYRSRYHILTALWRAEFVK